MMRRLVVLAALAGAGCSGPAAEPGPAPPRAAMTPEEKLAEIDREILAGLPKDQPTIDLLSEAGRYFEDPKFIWSECENLAGRLNEQGIKSDPREILRSSVDIMKRLGIPADGRQSLRRLVVTYQTLRESTVDHDRARTHAETVEVMVERDKYQAAP